MKKKKFIKISIFSLITLLIIGVLVPIYAQFKNTVETKTTEYAYKMLQESGKEISKVSNNEQNARTVNSIATQDYELPDVKITIGPDRIEKLIGEDLTIDANVSVTGDNYELKYIWFRVGRMEGTASVYNVVEGQNEEDLKINNLTTFNSASYQLAVKVLKDGQPLKKKGSEEDFIAYSKQVRVSVYPKLNINILGTNNSDVGDSIDIDYGDHYKFSADVYRMYSDRKQETTITAETTDVNGETRKDSVLVKVHKVPVTSIVLEDITLNPEQYEKIQATINPENATIKDIQWSIENGSNIIDLDEDGIVYAKEIGEATVKATVDGKEATCKVNVKKPEAKHITDDIDDHHIHLVEGEELIIHTNVHPLEADQELVWESSNADIATVEKVDGQNGKITAKTYKKGKTEEENTCTITVYAKSKPSVKLTYTVTIVEKVIPVEKMTLNSKKVEIEVGEEFDFNIEISPKDATYSLIEWSIDKDDIASIDDSGVVHAKKIGTATVTVKVTCANSECSTHTETAEVNVVETHVTGIEISNETLTLRVGDEENLTANVIPYNATNQEIKWESSNSEIVSVNQDGKITANSTGVVKGNGTATITARSVDNPDIYKQCIVTVTPVKVESLSISDKTLTLKEGKEYQLKATINPENATDKKVTWDSSNKKVATVDKDGNIKAIKEGTTTITVRSDENKEIYQECVVTVVPLTTNVTIYTVDQNKNFISGLKLKLTRITNEGEKDVTELNPTKGKYEIKGLEDGEYKISVIGELPNKDINGKEINIVNVVKDYTFNVKDGKVSYIISKEEETDVIYTNTLVLTNIVDYPDVEEDTDKLSANVGIGEDFTSNGKTIEEQYNEYAKNNPVTPDEPKQPNTPEKQEDSNKPDVDSEEKEPTSDKNTVSDSETEDEDLPDTSDMAIEVYAGVMIISILGIAFIIYKKRK